MEDPTRAVQAVEGEGGEGRQWRGGVGEGVELLWMMP